ncbi:Hypothetical protein CINCED_3A016998 [Cinara cedri]|uniref:Transcription factor TFIIIC triple barrel domain-containing protein n=1 Tax=Cinara cedri TaxID=506608 RepID=A0A5E4MQM2_9HEMI|nr:Hypothetical protein CINCED_3A016998 [Cinara cedri]
MAKRNRRDETMEHLCTNKNNEDAGYSGCKETAVKTTGGISNAETGESSDWEEFVEEKFIHVVLDSVEDTATINVNSSVQVKALETDSPILEIDNKIFHFNEWKYIPGTAMFFEQKSEVKTIDPLYDNRCGIDLEYIGSTRKCLEMTKKETVL